MTTEHDAPPIDRSKLPADLAACVIDLPDDPVRDAFVRDVRPHGAGLVTVQRALRRFASDFDVNAWLGTYRVCLVGRSSFDALLGGAPRRSLLDVGAGSGAVTGELASLFARVVVTETSRAAAKQLARSYETHAIDLATEALPSVERFSVVSLLHVLDRASRPRSLLEAAVRRLDDGGRLLVACPLPIRAHVDRGGATSDPDEWIAADGTFEEALVALVRTVIEPAGLAVGRVARTTYLSQGDPSARLHVLDDALLVCRPRASATETTPAPT
jgi:SAM-dependent methyltransferase